MYERQNTTGVRDFLVERLYSLPDYDIEFILPQLWYVILSNLLGDEMIR
jgi:hypothetical protein